MSIQPVTSAVPILARSKTETRAAHEAKLEKELLSQMSIKPTFKSAFPYQADVLALPVTDLSQASDWYCKHFGMSEVQRQEQPVPTVILQRDGTRIGFSINGGDASKEGAAILVSNILALKVELESKGVNVGDWRIDESQGKKLQVFFVVAPDGLCYYFHEPVVTAAH